VCQEFDRTLGSGKLGSTILGTYVPINRLPGGQSDRAVNRLQPARTLLDNGAGKMGKVPAWNAQAAGIQEGSADTRQGQSVSRRHFQKLMATPEISISSAPPGDF
jgi:hypothetical protein